MKLYKLKSSWKVETQFRSVAVSPNGQLLVTGGLKRPTVEVWNIDTGEMVNSWLASPPFPNPNVSDPIDAMDISSDGEILVTGGALQAWHLSTGKRKRKFRGFGGRALEVKISSDSKFLLSGGGVGNTPAIFVWNLKQGKKLHTLNKSSQYSFSINSNSKLLVGKDFLEETIKLWDITTSELVRIIDCKRNVIRSKVFTFSLEEKLLLGAGFDGIQIWNIDTGEKYQEVDKFKNVKFSQHLDEIHSVEILSDNKTILTAGEDSNVQIWDITTGKNIGTL
ncbi:MAG: hypothetical protein AAFN00_22590, partial [Cyanobacteria bacterium J06558_2]